jgi:MamI restriction endonuclease
VAQKYVLGDVGAAERLLDDLYVSLRRRLRNWAGATQQTPQPRMGYIGQHLTSVVTGYPGGRSGARGHDLTLPRDRYSEIKTCYRVDQLGKCINCGLGVASIEVSCAFCGSADIRRNDDSKWLLVVPSEAELHRMFDAEAFYLVLFDFADFRTPVDINARIWEVDPRAPGFALCAIDYFLNIRPKSKSNAAFNLWPFSLKFHLMNPRLIYHAVINGNDRITTIAFPGRDEPVLDALQPLGTYSRSNTLTAKAIRRMCATFELTASRSQTKRELLEQAEVERTQEGWYDEELADVLSSAVYLPLLPRQGKGMIPAVTRERLWD